MQSNNSNTSQASDNKIYSLTQADKDKLQGVLNAISANDDPAILKIFSHYRTMLMIIENNNQYICSRNDLIYCANTLRNCLNMTQMKLALKEGASVVYLTGIINAVGNASKHFLNIESNLNNPNWTSLEQSSSGQGQGF